MTDAQGGVLILCSIRSMLRLETFSLQSYIVQGYACVMGLGLALLGLLAVGGRPITASLDVQHPDGVAMSGGSNMMNLVDSKWSIAVIVFVYTSVSVVYGVSAAARQFFCLVLTLTTDRSLCHAQMAYPTGQPLIERMYPYNVFIIATPEVYQLSLPTVKISDLPAPLAC